MTGLRGEAGRWAHSDPPGLTSSLYLETAFVRDQFRGDRPGSATVFLR